MAEKVMPHNIDAEKSVLGSMFLSKTAVQKALENLQKATFYYESNGIIFDAISSLVDKGKPIDITTVTAELDEKKELKQVGNVEYLAEIVNAVPSASNVDEYIRIVEECSIKRRLIEEASEIVNQVYTSTEDLTDLLETAERKVTNVVKSKKGTQFRNMKDILSKTQSDLERLSQNDGEVTGIATGFYDIDKLTSGFHENELIIIAARPGMGKTAFALNIATNIAINSKKPVALFNMEMGAEQLATRMISSLGQIEGYKLRNGKLEHKDWKRVNEAMSRLIDTKLFIDDTPGMTIGEIRAKCRRLDSEQGGLGIIIIDYLQLISGSARYAGNRQQEVSEISRSLKTLAMELNVPVIALAQLSRSVEGRDDKRPLLSDLRESGSIEQDADIVAFLYRDDYYTKESVDEFTSKSEFIVAKHRNGPTKTIDLLFKKNTSTFVNFVNDGS